MSTSPEAPIEAALREELAQGDVILGTIGPVLGHLLANHDHALFSDEIVSRVRGMITDAARQMIDARAAAIQSPPQSAGSGETAALANALLADGRLVAHCHALALESQLTTRLEARTAIDPVLSPLLQALVASDDTPTASVAMAALASQARFVQRQRRLELPLSELPADLFHQALTAWGELSGEDGVGQASAQLRETFDESAGRLGLLGRLVHGMGAGVVAALSLPHAGVALFLSGLAAASNQDRDLAVIATNDRQVARLALSLRAAGLKPKAIEEQFAYLHPDLTLPEGFENLRVDRAGAMLASSQRVSAA